MIGGFGISFISSLMARILIPISLWFWVDLNDEIEYGADDDYDEYHDGGNKEN